MIYNGIEMTHSEYVIKKRGFEGFNSAYEMMKWVEKKTYGFSQSGHQRSFTSYYISDYAMDPINSLLTHSERDYLKQYQEKVREEYQANKAMFHGQFILDTLKDNVKTYEKTRNTYRQKLAQKTLDNFIKGERVVVYNETSYSNGFDTATTYYSDGTTSTAIYGAY